MQSTTHTRLLNETEQRSPQLTPIIKSPAMRLLIQPIQVAALNSHQQEIVKGALDTAYIKKNRAFIEAQIFSALAHALHYQHLMHHSYSLKKLTKSSFGTSRPKGAHKKELVRFYLIACLFRVWRNEFGVEPKVNRKITKSNPDILRTPFLVFAKEILSIVGIGKPEDHISTYRSYEEATNRGLSYEEWLQECEQKRTTKVGELLSRHKTVKAKRRYNVAKSIRQRSTQAKK